MCREREAQKTMTAQERSALRILAGPKGPPDDEDVEWNSLIEALRSEHGLG